MDLKKVMEHLTSNAAVLELVKVMEPLEIVSVLVKDLDLCPRDASKATLNLIKRAHNMPRNEAPDRHRAPPMDRHQFPPDPRERPPEWPFDDMTKAMMSPKNKGSKRPLMMSKNPLEKDLARNQPGAGIGAYSKSAPHSKGNAGFTKDGYAGWSKSPAGKEFNLPGEEERLKKR